MHEYTSLNFGMSLEEFQSNARHKLLEAHYFDAWTELRHLNLGADLIVTTFGDNEPVIIRVCSTGEVFWENHYSVIGAGSPIAEAFLCQRDYDDSMSVEECVHRVHEAKVAAEKNRDVGHTTMIELVVFGKGRYDFSGVHFDALDKFVRHRLTELPAIQYPEGKLEEGQRRRTSLAGSGK